MVLPLFKKAVKTVKTVIKSLAIDFMTVFYRFLKQNEKIWKIKERNLKNEKKVRSKVQ